MEIDGEILDGMTAMGLPPMSDPAVAPDMELLETMRSLRAQEPYDPNPISGVVRQELLIPGPAAAPDVPVRIYRCQRRAPTAVPGVVWMHGGGYVLGSYDMDAPVLDPLVKKTGCLAVSVEYRLAPEIPYPGPVEDCFAALRFLSENAEELGVDRSRLAVGGISGGGGLAAAVALLARDRGIPLIHQHLIYPMLDDTQTTTSSQWDLLAIWSRQMNAFAWQCYLGDLYGKSDVPPYAAPSRAAKFSGLAPAYIHVGALDGFLHEDIEYAGRLLAAGVPTELHVFPAAPHGFDLVAPQASISKSAIRLSDAALTRVLNI
jgi:acetyl esterase/lipase